jgi:hypothetical protein
VPREVDEDVNTVLAHLLKKSLVGELPDFPPLACTRSDFVSDSVFGGVVAVAKHLESGRVVACQKRLQKKGNRVLPEIAGNVSDSDFLSGTKPKGVRWDFWKLTRIKPVGTWKTRLQVWGAIVQRKYLLTDREKIVRLESDANLEGTDGGLVL